MAEKRQQEHLQTVRQPGMEKDLIFFKKINIAFVLGHSPKSCCQHDDGAGVLRVLQAAAPQAVPRLGPGRLKEMPCWNYSLSTVPISWFHM